MNMLKRTLLLILSLGFTPLARAQTTPDEITLSLRIRDAKTGQVVIKPLKIDPRKVGIVIVDPWNYHWCMTACERVSAMVPRWNRALECARKLGMPILWVPSDVLGSYSGYPQHERALGVPLLPVPKLSDMPPARFTAPGGGCMCGPGIACAANYGTTA